MGAEIGPELVELAAETGDSIGDVAGRRARGDTIGMVETSASTTMGEVVRSAAAVSVAASGWAALPERPRGQ